MFVNGLTTFKVISRGLPRLYIRNIPNRCPRRYDYICHRYRSGQGTHQDADRFQNIQYNEAVGFRNLVVKPVIFTVAVCAASFTGAIIAEYEKLRSSAIIGLNNTRRRYNEFFKDVPYKTGEFRRRLNRLWNDLNDGNKVAAGIIAINTGVILLWKIPKLFPFMLRWFTNSPVSGKPITLLTSTFSHFDWWHYGLNMFVLWNFSTLAGDVLGKEQFLATYLSAGVFASLGQSLYHLATRNTRVFGLGASGALMATLAVICVKRPDTELSIIFLPFFSFSIAHGMMAIVALDIMGLIFKWQFLSHSAHLSGALFGGAYIVYGQEYIWQKREALAIQWHKIRERFS